MGPRGRGAGFLTCRTGGEVEGAGGGGCVLRRVMWHVVWCVAWQPQRASHQCLVAGIVAAGHVVLCQGQTQGSSLQRGRGGRGQQRGGGVIQQFAPERGSAN